MLRPLLLASALGLACAPLAVLAQVDTPPAADAALVPSGFASAEVMAGDQRFRYVRGGAGEMVALLHGWPPTWAEWREVMPVLADAGYDVIALDLPGVGRSTNPDDDFSKAALARDLHAFLAEIGVERAHVVGHDIGAMIVYAYAAQFPEGTATLTFLDAPLLGTPVYDKMRQDPRAWPFAFRNAAEFPEALVTGREAFYIGQFVRELAASPASPDVEDIAVSVEAYEDLATLRAGFEWYRAFEQDAGDNAAFLAEPLAMPVLGLNGDAHTGGWPYVVQMLEPVAPQLTGGLIAGPGHWIPEEQPELLAEALVAHFGVAARP